MTTSLYDCIFKNFNFSKWNFIFRDLGEHLRGQLKSILGQPNIVKVNEKILDKQLAALEEIANDTHKKKYIRKYNSTASGLAPDQCKRILSQEFLDLINQENEPGLFKRFFKKKEEDPTKQKWMLLIVHV